MKQKMKTTMIKVRHAALRTTALFRHEARRFATEKRGDVNLASMVALTVVVVGAIMAISVVLNELMPNLVKELFEKIKETIGL